MKRNPDVGAACGRIHPTGSGYMQWWVISKNYSNEEEKNNVHHWIGQVSKVWVCRRTLAPEGDWAHAWLCSLQVDNHSWRLQLNLILSPGCFSLFRAKAIMDENVMHTYTTVASQPKHFVQYDQVADFKRQQQPTFSLSGRGSVAVHSSSEAGMEGRIFCCQWQLHCMSWGEYFDLQTFQHVTFFMQTSLYEDVLYEPIMFAL